MTICPLLETDIAGAAARRPGKVRGGDGEETSQSVLGKDIPLESSLILASGSMDPYVYLFDVGGGDGQYEVLQKLGGHTDRVYDVDFHPVDHVLASGSADFSVKVWGRASKRKK
jgi:WD40 repeat protein